MWSPESIDADTSQNSQTEQARSQCSGRCSETETSSSKPWASGRTLTAAQRARKRAIDRQSQRERRNRAKSRIAELEAKLKALLKETANKGGPEMRSEINCHETEFQRLVHTPELTTATWDMQDCAGTGTWTFSPSGDLITAHSPDYSDRGLSDYNSIINGALALNSTNQTVLVAPEFLPPSNFSQHFPSTSFAQEMVADPSAIPGSAVETTAARKSASTTQLCNLELSKVCHLNRNQVSRDEQANQDFLIRAVIQGWETVERRGSFCPLWELLHRIDDLIFCTSSNITRLVMLNTVHRMLLCRVKAQLIKELPPWYRPRPAQCRFQHEAVVGYFAWPGLRERLVLSEKSILSNAFWHYFARCFRFNWPYDFAEAFYISNPAGQIRFSGTFMNYLQDIRNWQMDHRFFAAFPELYDDFVPALVVPPNISLPGDYVASTPNPQPGSTVESEEVVASEYLCGIASPISNLVIPSQDPWNLTHHDFVNDTAPNWVQIIESYIGLPSYKSA